MKGNDGYLHDSVWQDHKKWQWFLILVQPNNVEWIRQWRNDIDSEYEYIEWVQHRDRWEGVRNDLTAEWKVSCDLTYSYCFRLFMSWLVSYSAACHLFRRYYTVWVRTKRENNKKKWKEETEMCGTYRLEK